jgi:hypothetical protein
MFNVNLIQCEANLQKQKKNTNVVPSFNHNDIIILLHFENLCHPSCKFVNLQMEIY